MEGVAAVVAELIVVGLDLVFVVVDVLHAPAADTDIAEVAALMAAGIVVVAAVIVVVVGVARVGVDIVVVGIAEVVAVVVVVVVATDHRAAAAG